MRYYAWLDSVYIDEDYMNNINPISGANIINQVNEMTAVSSTQQSDPGFSSLLADTLNEGAEQAAAAVDDAEDAQYPAQTVATEKGTDYSAMIADAFREEAARMSATAGAGLSGLSAISGMAGGYMPMQNQGLEEMILTAASSGQTSDAQIALFMLCMMMQTNQDGDFSMMMQMMASMLTQMQDGSDSLRGSVMASEYDPYILDTIDADVFGNKISSILKGAGGTTIRAGGAGLPVEHWRATSPSVTSDEGNRSPGLYRSVINQFDVETAERYRPFRDGYTYCNIYVWDVTSAMGAEIPLYTDPETGEPRSYPDIKGAKSMGAIAMDQWLQTYGEEYGWREVGAETAQRHANEGKPAVTSGGELGHMQVVCPSKDGDFDKVRGVTVAQAGRIVSNYTNISGVYGANALNNSVRYWIHD